MPEAEVLPIGDPDHPDNDFEGDEDDLLDYSDLEDENYDMEEEILDDGKLRQTMTLGPRKTEQQLQETFVQDKKADANKIVAVTRYNKILKATVS